MRSNEINHLNDCHHIQFMDKISCKIWTIKACGFNTDLFVVYYDIDEYYAFRARGSKGKLCIKIETDDNYMRRRGSGIVETAAYVLAKNNYLWDYECDCPLLKTLTRDMRIKIFTEHKLIKYPYITGYCNNCAHSINDLNRIYCTNPNYSDYPHCRINAKTIKSCKSYIGKDQI